MRRILFCGGVKRLAIRPPQPARDAYNIDAHQFEYHFFIHMSKTGL